MSKLKKRILALGMALVMTVSMIPMFASLALADEAPATIKVSLTVNNEGELAKATDGSVMAQKEVTVTDLDSDGTFTFDEAMIAAHKAYNTEDGYETNSYGYVKKLWGTETTNNLFFVNDEGLLVAVTGQPVKDGDRLYASLNADDVNYADWYTVLDPSSVKATEGDEVTLTLTGYQGMTAYLDMTLKPVAGATVKTADGTVLGTTDENGKVSFQAPATGEYIVTAKGTAKDVITDWYMSQDEDNFGTDAYVKFDEEMDSYYAIGYTEKDYGKGPYPIEDVIWIDWMEWFYDTEFEGYLLYSNQFIVDCPIMAPSCELSVVDIDTIKAAILALSADPSTFKESDKEAVETIWEGYQALSAEDQAKLDEDTSHPDTSQSLGRVLESALWAVWSYGEIDNSTTLPDGTYTATTSPAVTSTSSKGKSTSSRPRNWTAKEVVVENGKATATLMVDNTNTMTAVWIGGVSYPRTGGVDTGSSSSKTSEFANVPIDLNSTFYIGGVSGSMPAPTMYSVTTSIAEPLTLKNNVSMFKPETLAISGEEGNYVLHLTLGSTSYDKVFVGYASAATDDKAIEITLADEKGTVDIPVESVEDPIVLAFRSAKEEKYYNRTLTVDLDAMQAVFDPTNITLDQFDGMSLEEALARAASDTSVDTVNALIEAIQVQKRDENTDKYCKLAKAYYDALSDRDKKKLDDPGYFGDDTGDASLDDPRNQDEIGEKELLVVSFGTSFNESRVLTIKAVEDALAKAYPEYSVRRAFTAQIIINHIQSRDEEVIDNMEQALDRAVANNVKELVIQPTHLMHGAEYDEMCEALEAYKDKFDKISICEPLLSTEDDKTIVAKAVVDATIAASDYDSLDAADAAGVALVFMGHGTSHEANVTYTQMQEIFDGLGYKNVFVGTVEGKPESTALPEVKKAVENAGYTKVILRPLMVVAGDHANNDMAADEEGSWYYAFVNGGEFEVEGADEPVDIGEGFGKDNVTCQIAGLGEVEAVQQLYVEHASIFMPADYTAVDAAIAKAKTLDSNLYTEKSFKAVVAAVEAVVPGKTIPQQAEVDAMAKAIEDAITALIKVFADVANPDAWYYEVVYDIVQVKNANGTSLMSGYANGSNKFGATDPLTRQDFAIILYRLADEPEVPDMANPFTDASESGYYYNSVLWAKAENVISGYENGKFGVGDKITREQVATILYRFAKEYLKLDASEEGDLTSFNDGTAVSSWAVDALTWATGAGIITGKDNGTKLDARGNAARAEIAAMILRFLEYSRKKENSEVIAIIHTNDVHGAIEVEPYVKGLADEMKASGKYSLVLTVSAGDVYSGGEAVAGYFNGELIPAIEDQVYDVIVPGNNDFPMDGFKGNVLLTSLYKHTKTICANLQVKEDTDMAAYAAAYTAKIGNEDFAKMYEGVELKEDGSLDCSALNLGVIKAGTSPWDATMIVETEKGTKLGLFGLSSTFMGSLQGTVAAAKESVASLKEEGVDAIVGIGHTGWLGEGSKEPTQVNDTNSWVVASEVQDMDAFIDSHSHSIINDGHGCYVGDNKVLINQASSFGNCIGIMYIYLEDGKVVDKTAELIKKEDFAAITPDKDVQATVDAAKERIYAIAGDPLVTTPYYLNGSNDLTNIGGSVRANETNMGDFVTDVIRAAASEKRGKDYAFVCFPGYSIRGSVDENTTFTNIELAKIFDFYVAVGEKVYKAEDIVALVTGSLTKVYPQGYSASFMQMSGIKVTYTNDNGKGTPVTITVGDTVIYDANKGGIQVADDWSVVALKVLHNNDREWDGEEADIICKDQYEVRALVRGYLEKHEEGDGYKFYPNTIAPDNRIVEVK